MMNTLLLGVEMKNKINELLDSDKFLDMLFVGFAIFLLGLIILGTLNFIIKLAILLSGIV